MYFSSMWGSLRLAPIMYFSSMWGAQVNSVVYGNIRTYTRTVCGDVT